VLLRQAAVVFAAIAGALAAPAIVTFGRWCSIRAASRSTPLARRVSTFVERLLRPLRLAGSEGILPSDRERLRLQAAAGLAGLGLGTSLAGLEAGVAVGLAAGWLSSRSLVWRRARYGRRLDAGAAQAVIAIADALQGGHSVPGALAAASQGLEGPIGRELRIVGRELALGASTDEALERLRLRSRSRRIALIVAAVRVQRRSGGGLATLLRDIAATMAEQERLEAEARGASAQARFTSLVVLVLPLFGLVLAELASPGIVGEVIASSAGTWLVAPALVLQLTGLVVIRRLSRVES
jgi:tight adherence protein B